MTNHNSDFINEMKEALEAEKGRLEGEINASSAFPDYGRNDEDNATELADFAVSASTTIALKERLSNVTEALERIANGSYGVTDAGELIPEDRLRANPAATTIIK